MSLQLLQQQWHAPANYTSSALGIVDSGLRRISRGRRGDGWVSSVLSGPRFNPEACCDHQFWLKHGRIGSRDAQTHEMLSNYTVSRNTVLPTYRGISSRSRLQNSFSKTVVHVYREMSTLKAVSHSQHQDSSPQRPITHHRWLLAVCTAH